MAKQLQGRDNMRGDNMITLKSGDVP